MVRIFKCLLLIYLAALILAPETALASTGRLDRSLPVGEVIGTLIPIRERPTTKADIVLRVEKGTRLPYMRLGAKWAEVLLSDGRSGWIFLEYYAVEGQPLSGARGEAVVAAARNRLGRPYVWGGTGGRGYDCSGFVRAVFHEFGIKLPRTSSEQYRIGRPVSRGDLKPGDRLFFTTYRRGPSHVGIYIGDDRFIHASSARRTVTIDTLSRGYYRRRFIGARR